MKHNAKPLAVRWRYDAGRGAIVWQLMFTETGDLIGQKRFAAKRRALFFGIETATGRLFSDDFLLMDKHSLPLGEGWFTGLETTRRELAYCYASQPLTPEHQGIWAVDFRAGRVVWSRSDIGFVAKLDDEFLVCQTSIFGGFPERQFWLVDPSSGVDISHSALDSAQANAIREKAVPEEVRQQIILPEVVADDMVEAHRALQSVGISETCRCEYIVHGTVTVAALHEQLQLTGLWRSSLKVWQSGCLLYADGMEESVDKPSLNNFLIHGDNLYYLREREELVCVAIS